MSRMKTMHQQGSIWFLLFLCMMLTQTLNAQIMGCAKANFGIDGDICAGVCEFIQNPPPSALLADDWFDPEDLGGDPTPGEGIVDLSSPTLPPPSSWPVSDNIAFKSDVMTHPTGWVDALGNTWLAMVIGRDNNGLQGNVDATAFPTESNKNGDNPSTWECAAGSPTKKDDIIDYGGHLRRCSEDSLYFFGFVSTAETNGDKHLDFEFSWEDITGIPVGTSCIGESGENGGHTAWQCNDTNDEIVSSGDLLVSLNFTNVGDILDPEFFIWITEEDYTEATTVGGNKLGDFMILGNLVSGEGAAGFCYVQIQVNNDAYLCTTGNDTDDVPAPPYGIILAPQGNASTVCLIQIAGDMDVKRAKFYKE